jgi:hypothetical protein
MNARNPRKTHAADPLPVQLEDAADALRAAHEREAKLSSERDYFQRQAAELRLQLAAAAAKPKGDDVDELVAQAALPIPWPRQPSPSRGPGSPPHPVAQAALPNPF